MMSCKNNCLHVLAGNMFHFHQIIITMSSIILAHLLFYRNVSFTVLLAAFGMATILIHFNLFNLLNEFLVKYSLPPFWTKTGNDEIGIISLQYASFYLLIFIISVFYLAMCKQSFRSFDRVIWAWTFVAICVFSISTHITVGKLAFNDYQYELNSKIKRVLSSDGGLKKWFCAQEGFYCYIIEKNKLPSIKNSEHKIDERTNKIVIDALDGVGVGVPIVMSENKSRQNGTAFSYIKFGGVKLPNGGTFVLIDHVRAEKALDIYLIFLFLLLVSFLLIWGCGIYNLKRFHVSRGVV